MACPIPVCRTSGKRRETLTGEATVELLPHMKGLTDCADVAKCMSTEVITSRAKKFPMITFVDSPGLIDGDDKYPYVPLNRQPLDVNAL